MTQENLNDSAKQENCLKDNLSKIKNKIMVSSGKGGVGKTTVAVNLAYGLAERGYKVGILDIDLHGPNVAKMLGIQEQRFTGSGERIEPIRVTPNLSAVSLACLLEDQDQPVIWRGPRKTSVIKQFLSDVKWGELDYLIVDTPPGTGDETLSVCQLIPDLKGAIIVTTPQEVAILDSRKSIGFARNLNVPVIGVVENMSSFLCPHCNEEIGLFGSGGGEAAASDMGVPFLGKVPIDSRLVKCGDNGKPFVCTETQAPTTEVMGKIIQKVEDF